MIILMIIGIKVLEIDEVRVNTVLGYSMFKWKTNVSKAATNKKNNAGSQRIEPSMEIMTSR